MSTIATWSEWIAVQPGAVSLLTTCLHFCCIHGRARWLAMETPRTNRGARHLDRVSPQMPYPKIRPNVQCRRLTKFPREMRSNLDDLSPAVRLDRLRSSKRPPFLEGNRSRCGAWGASGVLVGFWRLLNFGGAGNARKASPELLCGTRNSSLERRWSIKKPNSATEQVFLD